MAIHEEMQSLIDLWTNSFVEGEIETCVEVYTKDATIYSPYSEPATGSDAIRDLFHKWREAGETNKRVTVEHAGGDGRLLTASFLTLATIRRTMAVMSTKVGFR